MTDSQEALALALGSEMPEFYEGLFQGDFPELLLTLGSGDGAEMTNQQGSGSGVAFPAEFAEVTVDQSDSGEVKSETDPAQMEGRTALEDQLLATRSALDLLRQELGEVAAKIEQLIERMAKVESELGLLKKTVANSRNKTNRPWIRRRRRDNE
jgi:hypothetical protein